MVKALIVEDQPTIAENLVYLLKKNFADISVLPVCDTVSSSLNSIAENEPDIVFMDVELHNEETGFNILQRLLSINFKVIFTTAHNQYAIQAIKFSALDYLLKPIDEASLREAVKRFLLERKHSSVVQRDSLISYAQEYQNAKVAIPNAEGYQLVPVKDIVYCSGESAQTMLHMDHQHRKVVSRTLKECDEILEKFGFCRIHKSYIVNLQYVQKYFRGDGGYVLLSDGTKLDVSKNYKDLLLSKLNKL